MDYERVRTQFDNLAETYSEITSNQHAFFDSNTRYLQHYKVAVAKQLVPDPATVLDYGCGIGLLQEFLNDYFPKSSIYAADISQDSLSYLRRHFPQTKVLDCEAALQQCFDLIVVSCVLHHQSRRISWLVCGNPLYLAVERSAKQMPHLGGAQL